MAETFGKKEKEKRRQQKKKEKEQRKAERKANAKSSASLEDMMAYVDENGNLSSTPPDPSKRRAVKEQEIVIGSRNIGGVEAPSVRKGRVTYFNAAKGYGFIKDMTTQESIFVHVNVLTSPIKENDLVSFQTEQGFKGLSAISVKKSSAAKTKLMQIREWIFERSTSTPAFVSPMDRAPSRYPLFDVKGEDLHA
jgi:cold shock CspA family protein